MRLRGIPSMILAAVLSLGLVMPANATSENFSDVSRDAWYANDVQDVQKYGIIEGIGDNKFLPDGELTFAQAIAMGARTYAYMHNEEIPDKGTSKWYEKYLDYALSKNLIYEDSLPMSLDVPCDRNTMARLFYAIIEWGDNTILNQISEIPDVDNNTGGIPIYSMYRFGILTGSDKYGTFYPDKSISRAETATILNRLLDQSKRKVFSFSKDAPSNGEEAISLALYHARNDGQIVGGIIRRDTAEIIDFNSNAYLVWFCVDEYYEGEEYGGYWPLYWVSRNTREVRFLISLQDNYVNGMVDLTTGTVNENFVYPSE